MLEYNKYSFSLVFEKKVTFRSLPSFIFRNNIGFQLRKITCVLKNQECRNCILRVSCIYSSVFETPIEKNNAVLSGRNKAPHPYAVFANVAGGTAVDGLILDIILIGTGVRYFPYILLTMLNIGKSGILKERVKFDIDDITCRGVSVMDKSDYSCKNVKPEIWSVNKDDIICQSDVYNNNNNLNSSGENDIKTVRINFLTPVRLQHKGRYLSGITYKDLIYAAVRRVGILNDFFGGGDISADGGDYGFDGDFVDSATEGKEFDADLKWVDYSRYSARQKQSMKMGGLVGTATVRGRFSEAELSLLKAAELFGIGKNVSFGLGRIGVEVTGD
ncbi:MAG: CRISPR system precrRNA processing endoribonuclease RAMP protein Cas6 [Candidatus Acidulodesulfobacterium sp.]